MQQAITPLWLPRSIQSAGWLLPALLCLVVLAGCMRTPVETADSPQDILRQRASSEESSDLQPRDLQYVVQEAADPADDTEADGPEEDAEHPFPRRVTLPEFPRDAEWVNTGGPIRLHDLRGRFVLLDFWTYCCINCMHVLPELEKLEEAYPDNLVVIGVHAAKFDAEEQIENVREAILRYDIHHPVVNDGEHIIWDSLGVSAWPTIVLIDPAGEAVYYDQGEFNAADVDAILRRALPYYRERDLLDETPLQLDVLTAAQSEGPLRYPGKVLADAASERLFIADTGHHRIVVTSLSGELLAIIGGGEAGFSDGNFANTRFNDPHGMALVSDNLYVADTGNHAIRRIDFATGRVETVAGTGNKGSGLFPGEVLGVDATGPEDWQAPAGETALASPWALWAVGNDLFIGMAGRHQIWRLQLEEGIIGLYAGNGREDIVDGPLTPPRRYERGFSSFAQPSGLTSDGELLYVADSEGSSIRTLPLDGVGQVNTLVGTAHLPFNRLFAFGQIDGPPGTARFQHPLGVAWHDGVIYVADTYNDVIRTVDTESGLVATLPLVAAQGEAEVSRLDEPEGLSYAGGKLYVADTNRHRILLITLASSPDELNLVTPFEIQGLTPPENVPTARRPDFSDAAEQTLDPVQVAAGQPLELAVELALPEGWKLNPLGPMAYLVEFAAAEDAPPVEGLNELIRLESPTSKLQIPVPAAAVETGQVRLSLRYFYCQEGAEGLCRAGAVSWIVPLETGQPGQQVVPLEYFVPVE